MKLESDQSSNSNEYNLKTQNKFDDLSKMEEDDLIETPK